MKIVLNLKVLVVSVALSASLHAIDVSSEVEQYLKGAYGTNPSLVHINIAVSEKLPISGLKGWETLIVDINGTMKSRNVDKNAKDINFTDKKIFFSNGEFIVSDITDMSTGNRLSENIHPSFDDK